MLQITKIFRFEMAHAIYGYSGNCRNIHGHSYVLHVTIRSIHHVDDSNISAPGFIVDFKELKDLVNRKVIQFFDHRLILSEEYLITHVLLKPIENLMIWKMEPTVENMLLFIRLQLQNELPGHLSLHSLKLHETNDSYAEWVQ